jgi:hypothetical protein
MIRNLLAAAVVAATALSLAAPASAQVWYGPRPVVAYAGPPSVGQYHVQGRVVSFDRFHMGVTVGGRFVRVRLHQGTIINPLGLTLQPGMYVHVNGYWIGSDMFEANDINLLN